MTPDYFVRLLDEAYEKSAWHGANLRGSLRGLTPQEALWRPGHGRHNTWELALHCAYWKYAVRRRLTGEKRGSFPRKGSDWFYADEPSEKLWRDDLRLLSQQHRALRAAVASASAQRLREMARIVHGAAFHDIYHAGQIQLIKKLQARMVNG